MSDDLKQRIAICLEDNASDAMAILEEHAASLEHADMVQLVDAALEWDEDEIIKIYPFVVGRADADFAKRMHSTLAQFNDPDDLFKVMNDDRVVPFHGAILDEMHPENMDDEELGKMLAGVSKLSPEHKLRVARSITANRFPDTEEYTSAIATLVNFLDDDTLLAIVGKMAEK